MSKGHATKPWNNIVASIKFSDLEKLFGDISQEQSLPGNIDQDVPPKSCCRSLQSPSADRPALVKCLGTVLELKSISFVSCKSWAGSSANQRAKNSGTESESVKAKSNLCPADYLRPHHGAGGFRAAAQISV